MNAFYEHHKDSIRWHYRCFDRFTPDCVFFSASDTLYDEHVFQDSATPATLVAALVQWVMFQRT